jgi:Xaa-Pro aminopeptidase
VIPDAPDLARMRADRIAKLNRALAQKDAAAAVLMGTTNVRWATGARVVAAEHGRAARTRNLVVVVAGDPVPHLFTHTPDGVPADHPADHVFPGLDLEVDAGAVTLVAFVADRVGEGATRVLLDEWTMPLRRAWTSRLPRVAIDDAAVGLMGEVKLIKTGDELACIRAAQQLNEQAMHDVYAALKPGLRQCDLSGIFLHRVFELGADQNTVDPIWQVMPASVSAGPRSVTGDVVFPTVTTDRVLAEGDVIWVDTGLTVAGYDSDFGRTWIVGAGPTAAQRDRFRRWKAVIDAVLAVTKPGVTGGDLTRAAVDAFGAGRRPWLPHLYLAHGIGVDSAEAPFIGTDLGADFDESIVLSPGMVFVLEPVAWADGTGGYRSEEIVAVTDDGYQLLSDFHYEPYAS